MEDTYRRVCEAFPELRVELISGRVVVNEVPTGDHNNVIALLLMQIMGVVSERNWRIWTNIKMFLGSQADRYIPDLVIVPPKPRMWGDDEVYGDSTLLAVEVVSRSSSTDDHIVKPKNCALAEVPLYLLIDPFQDIAILLSHPTEKGYLQQTQVPLGKPLDLPEPWKITIDTGKLIDT